MFIRESFTINKKTKTKYVTHRLIESYRTPKGPRQRVVMNLGTLTLPKSEWPKLAAILEARLAGQTALYEDDDPELSKLAAQKLEHSTFVKKRERDRKVRQENQALVSVDLNSVNTSDARSLGPELVAYSFWEHLGFDAILKSCGLSLEQRALAKAVIIGRLVAPGAELSTWQWLICRTALTELLPVDLSGIGDTEKSIAIEPLFPVAVPTPGSVRIGIASGTFATKNTFRFAITNLDAIMTGAGIKRSAVDGDRESLLIAEDSHLEGRINDTTGEEVLENTFRSVSGQFITNRKLSEFLNGTVMLG